MSRRDPIVQDYFGVDVYIIWQVVTESVPMLRQAIMTLLVQRP
jgi:uncharacterized protein with HEPN domain